MGTSLIVISSMAVFAAFLAIFAALSTAMPMNEKCCKTKTVGGIMYIFMDQMVDPEAYKCINGCVYMPESGSSKKFCFAKGDLEVECNDSDMKPTGGMPGMSPMPPMQTTGGMPGMSPTGGMPGMSTMDGMPGMSPTGGMPGMSPTGGMPGMSPMGGGMKPTGGVTGGDSNTVGPTKDYTPVFTCKGSISMQDIDTDMKKITCKDKAGVITKEGEIRCKEIQTTSTSTGAEQESKIYCCPDCPPMATMNMPTMNMPTFDFDFGPKF